MTKSVNHILAIKSLLAYNTPVADPCCVAITGWLVTALHEMFEPYQTVDGDANARALDLMLRWLGDHNFDAVIGAGSFAALLQSARETMLRVACAVLPPTVMAALPQLMSMTPVPACTTPALSAVLHQAPMLLASVVPPMPFTA